MASSVRRIQKEANGWGSKLGIHSEQPKRKGAARGARRGTHKKREREAAAAAYRKVPADPPAPTQSEERESHASKMKRKALERRQRYGRQREARYDDRANSHGAYRKSMWPAEKVVQPGRMG